MWRLAIPIAGIIGKAIYDVATNDRKTSAANDSRGQTTLESNLLRLRGTLQTATGCKSGVIGQPGAGKSSLLIKITEGKISPLPVIGVATDATNWADDINCDLLAVHDKNIFVDIPGYDTLTHPINIFHYCFPFESFSQFIFVIRGKVRAADEEIFNLMRINCNNIIVARSFSENLKHDDRIAAENDIRARLALETTTLVVFFSNRTGEGIGTLIKIINEDSATSGQTILNSQAAWPFSTVPAVEFEDTVVPVVARDLVPSPLEKLLVPSPALAAVVGTGALPRTEVANRMWAYIKLKGLQDRTNRRMINSDDELRHIFGKKQFSMFEMPGLLGKHLK